MNSQADNPWVFGFPVATLWGTRIRVNPLNLAIWLWLGGNLGWQLGSLTFILLSLVILCHEFCHVFAARWTGGEADDVILWPFGGLALCRRAQTFQSEFLVPAAGPLFHLLACVLLLPAVISTGQLETALHPIQFPVLDLKQGLPTVVVLILFALNAKLLYLNLLPMLPLDGSHMGNALARLKWDAVNSKSATLIISGLTHLVLMVIAMNIQAENGLRVLLITYMLIPITILEYARLQFSQIMGEFEDSQSFDLYGEHDRESRPRQPGLLERWRLERERKRQEQEERDRIETEARVDALLEKINQSGIESLSDAEKKFLKKASARYRDQGKPT